MRSTQNVRHAQRGVRARCAGCQREKYKRKGPRQRECSGIKRKLKCHPNPAWCICVSWQMTFIMDNKKGFIDFMTGAGVLTFGDFTTKSGRKTPYFVNTGNYKTGMHISTLGDFYADCVIKSGEQFNAMFGPAYKGITLAAATASSLYRNYGIDIPFFFNRKEIKDHGEGGAIVGYIPKDGDRIIIIEDVVTAGTAVRESLELLKAVADVNVTALFVSVDRMERGTGEQSTLDELRNELGVNVYSIITVRDIIDSLPHGDERATKMEEYLALYVGKQ